MRFTGLVVVISGGVYNWFYSAWDDNSPPGQTNGTGMRFTVDTSPTILVQSPTNTTFSTSTIFFNATNSTPIGTWIVNYNGTNNTLSDINTSLEVEDGFHQLLLYANSSVSGTFGLNDTIFFTVDATSPFLNVTTPHNLVNYHKTGNSLNLRWNITDSNLDVCRYEFEGTNTTVTCADNLTTISNVNNISATTLIFYSNDTFGNSNNSIVTWNYSVWENDRGLHNATTEGATELYYVDFTIETESLSTVNIWYDGNNTASPFSVISGRNYNATLSDFIVPKVDANKVVNVFWEINFGSVQANTTTSTQHINDFGIDDCSSNTAVLYNFSVVDEALQTQITSDAAGDVQGEIDLEIRSYSSTNILASFNQTYNQTNPFAVCLNSNLTEIKYNIDTQVQYEAENKYREFYHILSLNLNQSIFNRQESIIFKCYFEYLPC